jgi:hypothetical protein
MFPRRTPIVLVGLCCAAAQAQPPAGPMRQGFFRGRQVIYQQVGDRKIFEGDIILDHVTARPVARKGMGTDAVGVAYGPYLWPSSGQGPIQIPYITTNGATNLTAALNQFNTTFSGLIQFVYQPGQTDHVNFNFDPNNNNGQCESYVGHVGGEQVVTGSYSCSLGTLLHELGHVVGLWHEHERPDRNTYITFNPGNVILGSESNFTQLSDNFQDLGPYDYASIMHYIPYAFSRNGGAVLESIPPGIPLSNYVGYTAADIDGIARMYGAAPQTVTVTSDPPNLVVSVDGNAVTTPAVFTWKKNSTHQLGVAATAQTIAAGTFVYGRWSDSTQANHAVKVVAGSGTAASPVTSPATTVYSANFIRLSPYTATIKPAGGGSVAVSPAPVSYAGASGLFFTARQAVTLTPTPASGYAFLLWAGTSAPWSSNPKPDLVPDTGAPYDATAYFTTKPITTITTSPSGMGFYVDGDFWEGPANFASDWFPGWTPKTPHSLSSYSPQQPYSINTMFTWEKWSDGGALSHTITVPNKASTLTGTFTPAYVPGAYANPDCAATVSLSPPSSTGFYNSGTKVTVSADAAAGWVLTGWSGSLTGRKPTESLKVTDEELAVATYDTSKTPLSVTALKPATMPAGGAGGTVAIKGKGFTSASQAYVNGFYRPATVVSSSEIDVVLTSADLAGPPNAFPIAIGNFPAGAPCYIYAPLGFFTTSP